jgi:hypothetical protein
MMDLLDRRTFVRVAAGAAAGLTVQGREAAPKPMRLGVVTAGADSDAAIRRVRDLGFSNC